MNAVLKCLAVATTLAAGGCAVTPGYGGGYGGVLGGYGGYPSSGGYPSPGYGSGGYATGGQRFRCESDDGRQRYCAVDTRGGVELVRQLSNSPCVRGRTWNYDRNGVWVSQGCRGEFVVGGQGGLYGGGYPGAGYPGAGYPGGAYQGGQVRCESSEGRTRECPANTRGGIELVRQLSSSPCVEGRTWGYGRNSIWVSQGCRGVFATGIGAGSGYGGNYPGGGAYGQTVRCESTDNRQRRCNVPVRSGVTLVRQLSSTLCVRGSNWGFDRNGIWVDNGCRAEFSVR